MRTTGVAGILMAIATASTLSGCAGRSDPERTIVAEVAGHRITLSELDRYLRDSLPQEDAAAEVLADESARVKSRLLDDLLDEERLAAEALAKGLKVTDAEAAEFLAGDDEASPEAVPPGSSRIADARRVLLAQRLREEWAGEVAPPEEGEVERYLEAHGAELREETLPADPDAAHRALLGRARERLALEQSAAAADERTSELRARLPAKILRDALPFRYVP